jgi:GATA-binding protein
MLRADPPTVDASPSLVMSQESERFETRSPFPSTSFNFSYSPYDGIFDLSGSGQLNQNDYALRTTEDNAVERQYHAGSARSSIVGGPYLPSVGQNEGLSAAAAAASVAMAESYAQLNVANLPGVEEPGLNYRHLMSLVYPGLDNGGGNITHNPYTHVDPTKILSLEHGDNAYQSFHTSPSSDGWGNGHISTTASPEPYNTSNASTPPSTESIPNGQNARKYVTLKQNPYEVEKKRLPLTVCASTVTDLRSSTSTPDPQEGGPGQAGEDGETSTSCTNCQTTNTPLWRRDPDGQPLCMSSYYDSLMFYLYALLGNACGLFYVSGLLLCTVL